MLRNQEATFLKHLEDTPSCCRESVHGRKFETDRTKLAIKVCVDFKIRIFVVSPENIGTGLEVHVKVRLPKLIKVQNAR